MTEQEYEQQLNEWAAATRSLMAGNLKSGTHGSGHASKSIKVSVKENRKTGGHAISYRFPQYGVFVHYGVGRGWVRQGGSVVRGSKVKKGSDVWHQLEKKGYSTKELAKTVMATKKPPKGGGGRKPLDWFDSVLRAHINALADIASEYYGDYSTDELEKMLDRMTIGKGK